MYKFNKYFSFYRIFETREKIQFLFAALINALVSLCEVFTVYIIFVVFGQRDNNSFISNFKYIDIKTILLIIVSFRILFGLIFIKLQSIIAFNPSNRISKKLFQKIETYNYEHFNQKESATHVTMVINNTGLLPHYLIIPTINLISEAILVVIVIFYILFFSSKYVLFSLLIISVLSILIQFFTKKQIKNVAELRERSDNSRGNILFDYIGNWELFKTFLSSNSFQKKFGILSDRYIYAWEKTYFFSSFPKYLLESLVSIALTVLFFFQDKLSASMTLNIFSSLILIVRLVPSFSRIISSIQYLDHGKAISNSIESELNLKENNSLHISHLNSNKPVSTIELQGKNVTIGGKVILKDINLVIPKGFTTIVGISGSGKSTFLKALCNIIKFDDGGRVLLNSEEIEGFGNLVSFVPQSIRVIKGSILENIIMNFENSYDINRVYKSIQLSKFSCQGIINFDLKNLNEIQLNDNSLSGGERQRLGIARAIYSERPIICLDEISSALDSSTEKELFDSLRELSSEKFILSIAHRYSILNENDNIILFEDGKVNNYGTMVSLMEKSSTFKNLYDKYFNLN